MPTTVGELTSEDRNILLGIMESNFLDGECYAFAIALHQGLGYPLVGLMEDDVIRHAGVQCPNGMIWDIRGEISEVDFGSHFLSEPFIIQKISTEDLYRTRPIDQIWIKRARSLAEAVWPELPWVQSLAQDMKAFADDLEQISRKHGIWIRSCVPASPPHLSYGDTEEVGYKLSPTVDGIGFTIDRSYE